MNSRGRSPWFSVKSKFDPAGVAHFSDTPPWVCTHGCS